MGRIRARDGGLVAIAVLGLLLLGLAVHARPVRRAQQYNAVPSTAPHPPPPTQIPYREGHEKPHPSHVHFHLHLPTTLLSVLVQLLVALAVVAAVLLVIRLVPRLKRYRRAPAEVQTDDSLIEQARLSGQLSQTLDAAWAGLRRGDQESAIVACWLRLEELAELAGFPRQSQETSSELAARWSAAFALDPTALDELGALYREARFSSHQMSAQQVERAQRALQRLRLDVEALLGVNR